MCILMRPFAKLICMESMRIQIKIWYFLSIVHTSLSTYWKTLQPEIKIKTLGVLFKFEILTTQKSITKTMAKIRLQVWTSYYELNKKYETFFQYFNYVLQYRLFQRVWTWFFQNELYAMKTSYNFFCRTNTNDLWMYFRILLEYFWSSLFIYYSCYAIHYTTVSLGMSKTQLIYSFHALSCIQPIFDIKHDKSSFSVDCKL